MRAKFAATRRDLYLVRPHESSCLWQLWLRKEHLCTRTCHTGGAWCISTWTRFVWAPGTIAVQRSPESVAASLESFIDSEVAWVIEGCYGELVRVASAH